LRLFKLIPLVLLFIVMMPFQSLGSEGSSSRSFGDLKEIQERGELRIGIMDIAAPPFVYEREGVLMGYDVDISRDMAEALGVRATFVKISGVYDDVVQAVADGTVDIGMCELTKTVKRSQFVYFSDIYFVSRVVLAVNQLSLAQTLSAEDFDGNDPQSVISHFNKPGFKVATMARSVQIPFAQKKFPQAELVPVKNWDDAILKVYDGEADIAILASSAFHISAHNNPEYLYKLDELDLEIEDPIAIAVRPDRPELLRWVNDYLDIHVTGREMTIQKLIKRYLNLTNDGHEHGDEEAQIPEEVTPVSGEGNLPLVVGMHVLLLGAFWWFVIRKGEGGHWLLSPWAVLSGIFLGGVTGVHFPMLAEFFSKPAAIYMGFWRMCVLPIMITAIITSVYRLLSGGENGALIKRLLIYTPILLVTAGMVGVVFGVVGQPGMNFPEEAQRMLVVSMGGGIDSGQALGVFEQLMEMADKIVPDNVLVPLVENQSLSVLFIAVFFGIAITRSVREGKFVMVDILEAILDAFTRMIRASLYLLPFALYALALDFMAQAGVDLLIAIMRFVVCLAVAMMPAALFAIIVLSRRLRLPLVGVLKEFGPIFLLSFSARSSVISMPIGLEALGKNKAIDGNQAMAAFPFALLVCHATYAMFYTMTAVFIAQAFGVDLSIGQYLGVVLLGVMATVAAIGTIGMAFVLLLSIVCGPLGLPLEPAILVGMAVVSIIDPLLSAVQALFACGVTTLLVDDSDNTVGEENLEELVSQPEM